MENTEIKPTKIKMLQIEFEMLLLSGENISIEDVEIVNPNAMACCGE